MIYCTKCGKLNEESRNICESCGQDLSGCPILSTEKKKRIIARNISQYKLFGFIAGGIWLALFIAAAIAIAVKKSMTGELSATIVLAGFSLIPFLLWFLDRMFHDRVMGYIDEREQSVERFQNEHPETAGAYDFGKRLRLLRFIYSFSVALFGVLALLLILVALIYSV